MFVQEIFSTEQLRHAFVSMDKDKRCVRVRPAYELIDQDHFAGCASGSLDPSELLKWSGEKLTRSQIEALIKEADTDGVRKALPSRA